MNSMVNGHCMPINCLGNSEINLRYDAGKSSWEKSELGSYQIISTLICFRLYILNH